MPLEIDLTGKRALVTGAGMGIGASIAQYLARAGAIIAGCGLEAEDSEWVPQLYANVQEAGSTIYYRTLDVTEMDGPQEFVNWALERLGGIDVVVSNAGANCWKGAQDCTDQEFIDCMNLNLGSHWRLAKAAYPHLLQAEDPAIAIMSSIHGMMSMKGTFPYPVFKGAAQSLVRSLALDYAPDGIRVNGIAPGAIITERARRYYESQDDGGERLKRAAEWQPLQRTGRTEDVAGLAAYLVSPLAGFITGQTILVDGGKAIRLEQF